MKSIMKNVTCLIVAVALFANMHAQNKVRKTTGDFHGIDIGSGEEVKLISSDSNYVELSSKDSVKNTMAITVQKGILEIPSDIKGKIEVHMSNITSIKVHDAAKLVCADTFKTAHLTIQVSDAGIAEILVHAKSITATAKDGGSIKLSGSADSLKTIATDAGTINSSNLRSLYVQASSTDGADITVRADSSIHANSSDGGSIKIVGSPRQKVISASDGGIISSGDTCNSKHWGISGEVFIGGGFVTGGSNGTDVKYGNSREFIVGLGHAYNIVKWNALGCDLYYKSTDFYIAQNASKTFPEPTQYQSEKVSTQNFGALIYDRFNIGKHLFLDGGVFGDWAFHSKHIIWNDNTSDGSTDRIKTVNLSYVNPFDYGLTARFGTQGVALYFNYRMSKVFQNTNDSGQPYPTLPQYVVGLVFIL